MGTISKTDLFPTVPIIAKGIANPKALHTFIGK